jgi:ABC-2 type transport system permease protein
MFFKIVGFEFRYQMRQPIFWVGVVLFALFAFGFVASSNINLGSTGNIHKNAPFVIAQTCVALAIFYLFVVAAFTANVIVRDDETGFAPILRSTPIRKFDYLYGRFLGAFAAAAVAFLAVPVGFGLGSLAPWIDHETLGPFVVGDYVYLYLVLGLPVVFLGATLFFALTTITRSMMWTYVGFVALLVLRAVFAASVIKLGWEHVAAVWEPFGASAFAAVTQYWTPTERNTLMPALRGDFLLNKVIWMSVALAVLAITYRLFSFQSAAHSGLSGKGAKLAAEAQVAALPTRVLGKLSKPVFNVSTTWTQLWARTKLDMGQVFLSPAYFVLVGLATFLSFAGIWLIIDVSGYGGRLYPVTRQMVMALTSFFGLFGWIIAVYYAGELVWRERERNIHEIIDATSIPDWMFVAPKTLAISLVLISTLLAGVGVALISQAIMGFFIFQIDKYLLWYLLPNSIDLLLITVLAIFVQAMVPHKFIGWAVMVAYLIFTLVMGNLGFEHHLYRYATGLAVPLSDMNGQGHFWIGAYWFRLYWSAFALILLVIAHGLWRRGTAVRFMPRLRHLPAKLKGTAGIVLAVATVVFVGAGVYIFINTNVWNPYRTALGDERWAADYEEKYLRYEALPQPKIAEVKLNIDLYPHQDRARAQGRYVIQNRTGAPIGVLHLRFPRDLAINSVDVQGAHLQSNDAWFNYRIYRFDTPMQPGEIRTVSFSSTLAQRGFRNSGDLLAVMDNGTFVNRRALTPKIGMDRQGSLQDRAKRRKYGLPPEPRMAKLGQPGADAVNYLTHDSDWVRADFTVTTDADQIPVAPGYLLSDTVKNGRRTIHVAPDAPILYFMAAQSAKYSVANDRYKGIDISVYYDPQHPWNVSRIQRAMRAGLDYYQANFSPYQFHQVRVQEFPAPQGIFAQSFPNTIPWSEGAYFISDNRNPDQIDSVTYVGAHELGHQWWAHQIIGADEQGGTVLSETLAQYSAMMVMKRLYGPDLMRKFLKYELDSYLRARSSELVEEEPLERVENQPYIHYNKGALVMYRLQDEIGEDVVNRALRHLLHDFAFKGPPYPTALDLVGDLRREAPADKQALITDLFEKITLYDVKARHAAAVKRADGRYDLTLTIEAKKLYADGQGRETAAPMDEVVDIGAFDLEPGKPGFKADKVIAFQRVAVHSGVQTVTLVVGRAPKFAGVDPYNKLIDRNSNDNVTGVTMR